MLLWPSLVVSKNYSITWLLSSKVPPTSTTQLIIFYWLDQNKDGLFSFSSFTLSRRRQKRKCPEVPCLLAGFVFQQLPEQLKFPIITNFMSLWTFSFGRHHQHYFLGWLGRHNNSIAFTCSSIHFNPAVLCSIAKLAHPGLWSKIDIFNLWCNSTFLMLLILLNKWSALLTKPILQGWQFSMAKSQIGGKQTTKKWINDKRFSCHFLYAFVFVMWYAFIWPSTSPDEIG